MKKNYFLAINKNKNDTIKNIYLYDEELERKYCGAYEIGGTYNHVEASIFHEAYFDLKIKIDRKKFVFFSKELNFNNIVRTNIKYDDLIENLKIEEWII